MAGKHTSDKAMCYGKKPGSASRGERSSKRLFAQDGEETTLVSRREGFRGEVE
jgi:hypothetical protein